MNNNGSISVITLILLFLTGIIGFSYLKTVSYEADAFHNDYRELKSFWRTEEAISKGIAQIKESQPADEETGTISFSVPKLSEDEDFTIQAKIRGIDKDTLEAYALLGDGTSSDTIQHILQSVKPKFANEYFMLFDDPGDPYFLTGDTIDGKVHSNQSIKTAGTPYFTDVVEVAVSPTVGYKQYNAYKGEPSFSTPIVWDSRKFLLKDLAKNIRNRADKKFSNPGRVAEVHLKGETFTLRYRDAKNSALYTTAKSYPLKAYKSLYFTEDVEIKGSLKGALTIGSKGSIIITDDLLYQDSNLKTGKPSMGSQNILGLIAEENVKTRKPYRKAQAEGGLKVNAAIVALNRSLETENLYHQGMGTFHLWGSITEMERGINAISRDEKILFGYHKSWHYDRRFLHMTPPEFTPIRAENGKLEYRPDRWKRSI